MHEKKSHLFWNVYATIHFSIESLERNNSNQKSTGIYYIYSHAHNMHQTKHGRNKAETTETMNEVQSGKRISHAFRSSKMQIET